MPSLSDPASSEAAPEAVEKVQKVQNVDADMGETFICTPITPDSSDVKPEKTEQISLEGVLAVEETKTSILTETKQTGTVVHVSPGGPVVAARSMRRRSTRSSVKKTQSTPPTQHTTQPYSKHGRGRDTPESEPPTSRQKAKQTNKKKSVKTTTKTNNEKILPSRRSARAAVVKVSSKGLGSGRSGSKPTARIEKKSTKHTTSKLSKHRKNSDLDYSDSDPSLSPSSHLESSYHKLHPRRSSRKRKIRVANDNRDEFISVSDEEDKARKLAGKDSIDAGKEEEQESSDDAEVTEVVQIADDDDDVNDPLLRRRYKTRSRTGGVASGKSPGTDTKGKEVHASQDQTSLQALSSSSEEVCGLAAQRAAGGAAGQTKAKAKGRGGGTGTIAAKAAKASGRGRGISKAASKSTTSSRQQGQKQKEKQQAKSKGRKKSKSSVSSDADEEVYIYIYIYLYKSSQACQTLYGWMDGDMDVYIYI